MEDNPERNILVDPTWPKLIDGAGYVFLLLGGMPFMKEGNKFIKMKLRPDDICKKRYNLRAGVELDVDGNFWLIVDEIDIIELNPYDAANRKFLFTKTIKNEETELSKRDDILKQQIDALKHDSQIKMGEIYRLREKLEMAKLQTEKDLKLSQEVYRETGETFAKMFNKQENKQ